jgi:hypothetical protein
VLHVSEREGGEVEERVALGRLGPVDDAGDCQPSRNSLVLAFSRHVIP